MAGREEELEDEVADVLGRLIRFDTVNPPGAERAGIEWLAGYLSDAGLECELHAAEPERPNLVARLSGPDPQGGPVLGYLSHMDTVLADPADWTRDPWSGELHDGAVWGRGALDMKDQTAAEAVALASLARAGWRPERGEVKLFCVADEEAGGTVGAKWLTEERPDAARADYLLNEGGGAVMPYGDRRLYGVCVAEKGTFRFRVTARGLAGHASVPGTADNALLKLTPALQALASTRATYDLTEAPRVLVEALGESADDLAAAVEHIRAVEPRLAALVEPTLGVTMVPTRISASEKINVIPARAEAGVDCRLPPGMDAATAMRRVREALGGDVEVEVEPIEDAIVGNRSGVASPLMDANAGWIVQHDPGTEAVP